jgi:hypothetical protein
VEVAEVVAEVEVEVAEAVAEEEDRKRRFASFIYKLANVSLAIRASSSTQIPTDHEKTEFNNHRARFLEVSLLKHATNHVTDIHGPRFEFFVLFTICNFPFSSTSWRSLWKNDTRRFRWRRWIQTSMSKFFERALQLRQLQIQSRYKQYLHISCKPIRFRILLILGSIWSIWIFKSIWPIILESIWSIFIQSIRFGRHTANTIWDSHVIAVAIIAITGWVRFCRSLIPGTDPRRSPLGGHLQPICSIFFPKVLFK